LENTICKIEFYKPPKNKKRDNLHKNQRNSKKRKTQPQKTIKGNQKKKEKDILNKNKKGKKRTTKTKREKKKQPQTKQKGIHKQDGLLHPRTPRQKYLTIQVLLMPWLLEEVLGKCQSWSLFPQVSKQIPCCC
jgi:hypothetical protein